MGTSAPLTLNLEPFERSSSGGTIVENKPILTLISDGGPWANEAVDAYKKAFIGHPVENISVDNEFQTDSALQSALAAWRQQPKLSAIQPLVDKIVETQMFKMIFFANYTATKAIERFNARNIIGALYQNGNAIKVCLDSAMY